LMVGTLKHEQSY